MTTPETGARRYGIMSDFAATSVRERIVSGMIVPGDSLRIDQLAAELKISATPVREALQALRTEGFVESTRGQGYRVLPITSRDIEDVFLVHAAVAGELAARAAEEITEAQLAHIEYVHYQLMAAATRGDVTTVERRNDEFHRALNRIVDAPRLRWLVGLCAKYVPRGFYGQIDGWPEATRSDHTEILEALRARDPELTRSSVTEHLRHSGRLLAEHYETVAEEPQ